MAEIAHSIARIAVVALVAYVIVCCMLYFNQAAYVYYPDRNVGLTPAYFRLPYEDLRLKTDDGETIAGWYVPAGEAGAATNASPPVSAPPVGHVSKPGRVALYCHGNGGNIAGRLDMIVTFRNMGLSALIFDYRGYGDSTGKPTEQGTYLDAKVAWDFLTKEKGVPPENIVIYGESMGGAVGAWLAERTRPGALILDSTFASAVDMARKMFPILPVKLICKFKYDTLSRIGNVGCPILVAHSVRDEMIPFKHGKRLFDAAQSPKQFIEMAGLHNDGGIMSSANHLKSVEDFLDRHLGKPPDAKE